MQLVIGIVLFTLGALWMRACLQKYADNPVAALWDDLWDFLWDRIVSIAGAAFITVVGGLMILHFFYLGKGLEFTDRFPFIERRPAPETAVR